MVHDTDANDWWVIQIWREAIARIKASGIPYTIFYPTNFMETLPQRHMMGRALVLPGKAHYPNYWIAGRDFGPPGGARPSSSRRPPTASTRSRGPSR